MENDRLPTISVKTPSQEHVLLFNRSTPSNLTLIRGIESSLFV